MPRRVKLKNSETGELLERYAIDARELLLTGEYELVDETRAPSAPAPVVATTMNKPLVAVPDGLRAAEAVGKSKKSRKE